MKRYPKIVQCDNRGQIVIPKDVRQALEIEEGSGFYMFTIQDEGILLKKIPEEKLSEDDNLIKEIDEKADKIGLKKKNLKSSIENYKNNNKGGLEEL